jgi:hypothetical protein
VKLSRDEARRLKVYDGLSPSPVLTDRGTMPPFPPGCGSAAHLVTGASSLVPGSGPSQHGPPKTEQWLWWSGLRSWRQGPRLRFVLKAPCAYNVVKQAIAILSYRDQHALILYSDDVYENALN